MKKSILLTVSVVLLLASCGSSPLSGGVRGSQIGYMVGSAVGGIAGGGRGHDVGALIGMASGAAVGAAVGTAVERAQQRRYESAVRQHRSRTPQQRDAGGSAEETGNFDPNMRGDDRITFGDETFAAEPALLVRHVRVDDDNHDGTLTRGEECTVRFEIMNNSPRTVYDVFPLVEETTGSKHIRISAGLRVESIAPYQGVRYTATVRADRKLKDGKIVLRVGVAQGQQRIDSQVREFTIPTKK